MKHQIATDKNQSQRLLSAGAKPETADMAWMKVKTPSREGYQWVLMPENFYKDGREDSIPAWSLSSLLSILPKEDETTIDEEIVSFPLILESTYSRKNARFHWRISYGYKEEIEASDPIEACVQLIEWLTSNGYKLNER